MQTYARFGSTTGPGVTNAYDGAGRQASTGTDMDGTARSIAYRYDADGNRVEMLATSDYDLTFDYDGLDRMTGIPAGAGTWFARFAYDPAGRRSALALAPGGTSSATYGYDSAGRLSALTHDPEPRRHWSRRLALTRLLRY